MKLSKTDLKYGLSAATSFNQALQEIPQNSAMLGGSGAGEEEDAIFHLDQLRTHPNIKVPAEEYVNFAHLFRVDWSNKADAYDRMATHAIRDINSRPYIQAEYERQGLPPVDGPESYILLDRLNKAA